MLMRLGATLAILLPVSCLYGADAPSQDSAKLPTVPVFTRAEMAADLEHLTAHLTPFSV
jgi:hypothetical protein